MVLEKIDLEEGRIYSVPTMKALGRLDREIHGLLTDLGIIEQRTDEFVDQEELVKRFMAAWREVVEKIEVKVIKQVKAGKTEVKI